MTEPVPVAEIWDLVPHRPPMVWVDEVLEYSETSGETTVEVKAEAHYMDEAGSLRPSACLEFCAQSYGFISICYREFSGNPIRQAPKRAFLASFNEASFAPASVFNRIKPGDALHVYITGIRTMGPIILFKGHVKHVNEILCETRMKVFSE